MLLLGSCIEFPTGPLPPPGPVVGLHISVAARSPFYVLVGEQVNVMVEAYTDAGYFVPPTSVTFASGDPGVASVNSRGQLRGLRAGTVLLTVNASGRSATVPVHVRAHRCSAARVTRTTSTDATLADGIDLESCALDGYGAAEGWRLTLSATTTIAVDRTMGDEALQLVVKDANFATVPEAFSVLGSNMDRTRNVRTLAPGTYYLFAASVLFDSSATFSLRMTPQVACSASTASDPVDLVDSFAGAFGPSRCVLPDGRSATQWVLQTVAPVLLAVQTVGSDERVHSAITGPDSLPLWTTESVVLGDSGVLQVFEVKPGRNVLWVLPHSDTTTTAFTATVRVPQVCAADSSLAVLALGDTLRAALDTSGCLQAADALRLSQPYSINVPTAGVVQYDLITSEFHGLETSLRNAAGQSVPVTVQYIAPGTTRYTATVSPGVWQVLVTVGWGYTPDADFALLLRNLP